MRTLTAKQEEALNLIVSKLASYNPPIVEATFLGVVERCEWCGAEWHIYRDNDGRLRQTGAEHKDDCIVYLARILDQIE